MCANHRLLRYQQAIVSKRKTESELISLRVGEPEFDTPSHIVEAACSALRSGFTRYGAVNGLIELMELIAHKIAVANDIAVHPHEIVVTSGVKMALFLACRAILEPGDEVIIPAPYFSSYVPLVLNAQPTAHIKLLPLLPPHFALNGSMLEEHIGPKTRMIILNYPNNPTGSMLDSAEMSSILEVINRCESYLVSDEVYGGIVLDRKPHISFAHWPDYQQNVIVVNGFKEHAMAGWRIGYVHAPMHLIPRIVDANAHINSNTPTFVQKAAVAALTGPTDHVDCYIRELLKRKSAYDSCFRKANACVGTSIDGGFFGFVDISSTGLDSDTFCARLIEEKGIVANPGIVYGRDYDDWVRVSLCNSTPQVIHGLREMSALMTELALGQL